MASRRVGFVRPSTYPKCLFSPPLSGFFYALMPLAEHELDRERAELEAWRLRCLIEGGYKHHRAEQLAGRPDVDVHRAVDLLRDGCDQPTALRILL